MKTIPFIIASFVIGGSIAGLSPRPAQPQLFASYSRMTDAKRYGRSDLVVTGRVLDLTGGQ